MADKSKRDTVARFRPRVLWRDGAPTMRGLYWVAFRGESVVECVAVQPAWIHRNDPNANLLVHIAGGLAYRLEEAGALIERHAIAWPPIQPSETDAKRGTP